MIKKKCVIYFVICNKIAIQNSTIENINIFSITINFIMFITNIDLKQKQNNFCYLDNFNKKNFSTKKPFLNQTYFHKFSFIWV